MSTNLNIQLQINNIPISFVLEYMYKSKLRFNIDSIKFGNWMNVRALLFIYGSPKWEE